MSASSVARANDRHREMRWADRSWLALRVAAARLIVMGACGLSVAPCGAVQAATPGAAAGPAQLSGIWWISDFEPHLLPPDDSALPFTAAARLRYEQSQRQLAEGAMPDVGTTKCLPMGLPRTLLAPYPMQILQHGAYVTFVHEVNHTFWSVALETEHPGPDDLEPAFMGDSIGHWDGSTLVIDSVGFKANSFLDDSGVPHGTSLHVTTRLRLRNASTLEAAVTVVDPDTFTHPFTVRRTYEARPDVELMEYPCGGPHRALTGARNKGVRLNWVPK